MEDARFILRSMHASIRYGETQSHVPALALLPTFGLATHESRRWLAQHHPDAAAALPEQGRVLIETIRNTSKWVDGVRGKPDIALDRFRSVVGHHRTLFYGKARYKWAQRWETDLGVFRCGGVDVLNTHTVGLLMGDWLDPRDPSESGPAIRDASSSMSAQASALVGDDPIADGSFIDALPPITLHDFRSERYYSDMPVPTAEGSGGYTHLIRNSLAWLRLMRASNDDERGAVFKFRFVGLYHAASALQSFRIPVPSEVELFLEVPTARALRNALVHYSPHHDSPRGALDPERPRAALVEHAYNSSFDDIEASLERLIVELHMQIDSHVRGLEEIRRKSRRR